MSMDIQHCTARPQTSAGSAYLMMALDPCGEHNPVDYRGIPDGSEVDIVPLRMRDDLVLTSPEDVADDNWGYLKFDTPYLIVQQIFVRYRSSIGPPTQTQLREYINGLSLDATDLCYYPRWFRPRIRVVEVAPVGTSPPNLNISNLLAGFEISFLRPAVLSAFSLRPDADGWGYIRKYRFGGKGTTTHLNAPATATQGRMVSGQVGTESSNKIIAIAPTGWVQGSVPSLSIPARFTVTPPFDFNVLPQQDLNARQDLVKTGSYDMQRHWNGSHIWNEVEDVRPIWRTSQFTLYATWFFNNPQFTDFDGVLKPISQLFKYDGFDVSLGWGIYHADGLSNQASIHVKHRSFWEVNVPGTSPWAANKMAPCPHDAGALALEKQLGPCTAHSYEAVYNDRGLLADMLKSVLRVGGKALRGGLNGAIGSLIPNRNVIDDPYAGPSLYGERGFSSANGNGKKNGKRNGNR